MKKIIVSIGLLTGLMMMNSSCNSTSESDKSVNVDTSASKLPIPNELITVDHAMLIAYSSSFDGESSFSDYLSKNYSYLTEINITNDPELKIKEKVSLDQEDVTELLDILYQTKCSDDLVGNCFTPNHAVVYYNQQNEVVGYSEICIDCMTSISSENVPTLKLCTEKIDRFVDFMKEHEITFFEDLI